MKESFGPSECNRVRDSFHIYFYYTPGIQSMPWGYIVFVFSVCVCLCVNNFHVCVCVCACVCVC